MSLPHNAGEIMNKILCRQEINLFQESFFDFILRGALRDKMEICDSREFREKSERILSDIE